MKLAICPKCKSKEIKVIKPKKEITFMCENCKFEKELGNSQLAKRLNDIEQLYIDCLTRAVVYGRNSSLDEIRDFKLEQFSRIMEEEQEKD